ncbi:MAG: ferritin-like domain-containing protein [Fimbriimonadaceae bacterium]
MKINTFEDLYVQSLRDMYSAETQLLKALKIASDKATDPTLKQAFLDHREETQIHHDTVKEIVEKLDEKASGHTCDAMKGLIEETQEAIEDTQDNRVLDAALISMAQKIEHYEIASYGTIRTFAEILGKKDDAQRIQKILDQEYAANDKLTKIAEKKVNEAAAAA